MAKKKLSSVFKVIYAAERRINKNLGWRYYAHPIWNLSLKIDHYFALETGKKGVEKLSAP